MPCPQITTFCLGAYQTNCFVVAVPDGNPDDARRCWIVDCGYEPESMLDWIEGQQLQPEALLLTHCHSDHIAGIDQARARFGPLPIHVHEAEAGWCADPARNLSAFLDAPVAVAEPDHHLRDGEVLSLAGTTWRVVHTPGHSPGGVCFVHDESGQAIVGDTLFAGGIGRFDFPTSDVDALRHSIHEVILALPDGMKIFPGHGPATEIGRERRTNPFVLGGF